MSKSKLPNQSLLTPDHKFLGGARQQSLDSNDAHNFLWAGRVIHVDTETMVCSVRLETGNGERHDVPLPAPGGGGPRSWSGSILEPGSKVILGWKKYDHRSYTPYILQVMTTGVFSAREYEPFSSADPEDVQAALAVLPDLADDPNVNLEVVRLKARKGYAGDFLASSSSGSDLILDRDVYFTNRAGNEFRLRDSDQTAILQTSNEFVNNSAGIYRRGLIRRDAFNLLLDLIPSGFDRTSGQSFDDYLSANQFTTSTDENEVVTRSVIGPTGVPKNSPAYDKLLEFGLIKEDGTQNFPDDPNDPFYPYVVHSDGQRASYVVPGEHGLSFSESIDCYVEDRVELRHTSDGIMSVTSDGDGVQIDPIGFPKFFIEDVKGTVVGNDPHTESGRSLYKQILTMRLFDSPEDGAPSAGPKLEPIDTVVSQTDADTKALCRLFRVQCPSNSNQYAFGISKEGRVFLHVPKSTGSTPDEAGRSVDANILGVIKAIVGMDSSRTSLDFTSTGGLKLNVGSFKNEDPEDQDVVSIDLTLAGKMRVNYNGVQGRESIVSGNDLHSIAGSSMNVIGGNSVENIGGAKAIEANAITLNAGAGGLKAKFAGDMNQTVLGKTTEMYAQIRISTFALADTKVLLAGVDTQTVLVGGIVRTVASGTGITDTVTAGNYVQTCVTGNMTISVGTGNLAATVGTGNLALTAGAGNATFTGGVTTSIVGGSVVSILAPVVKLGTSVVGCAVAGVPGPPAPYLDPLTGIPALGISNITVGP